MEIHTITSANEINHISSSRITKIKYDSKDPFERIRQWYKYAEDYANSNGLKLLTIEGNRIVIFKE